MTSAVTDTSGNSTYRRSIPSRRISRIVSAYTVWSTSLARIGPIDHGFRSPRRRSPTPSLLPSRAARARATCLRCGAVTPLTVRHVTTYRYAAPVSFGRHRLMLRPRDSHELRLESAELAVSVPCTVGWMYDVFGNSVAFLDFTESASSLSITST